MTFEESNREKQRRKHTPYGTKQAARLWQQALIKHLLSMGFKQSPHDPCIFRYVGKHGECLIGAYVDDILCACSSKGTFDWFSSQFLHSETNPEGFYGKHLGKVNYFLGMAIDQYDDFDDQIHYVRHDYEHQRVRVVYVPTDRQRADGFTKPLDPTTFFRWRENVVPASHPPV